MKNIQTSSELFKRMLNLEEPWSISNIVLDTDKSNLTIEVKTTKGSKLPCPECGQLCSKEDHRKERSWRHLDTMQFETLIKCKPPRVKCPEHGIVSVNLPWVNSYSRFTEIFE